MLKYYKVRDHWIYTGKYRGAAHDICNLRYKTPKEIPVVFRQGSTYDYHVIMKELAQEFQGQFECLGENAELKNEDFIKNYDEDSDKGYILEIDVKYPKRLHNLPCGLRV